MKRAPGAAPVQPRTTGTHTRTTNTRRAAASGLLAEAAWAAAWHGRDAARARAWLAEAGRGSRVFDGGLGHAVARAAVASREGRSVEMRDAVADARRALAAAPALAGSGVQVAAERLAQLEATLAAMPAPVPATLAPVAT